MNPASHVIKQLGGETKVRELTGASVTAPYRWQYAKDKGGTGGLIPQRYHRTLLDYAQDNKIDLSAEDFLPERQTAGAA